jgi:hypothetical protein
MKPKTKENSEEILCESNNHSPEEIASKTIGAFAEELSGKNFADAFSFVTL